MDLANFDYAKYFSQDGYDIYNKKGKFYKDVCSPASINNNDIILRDRKKYIYPNNVTLCKKNCEYKDVNIEQKRIVCECNLKSNKLNDIDENNNFVIDENDDNFLNYFLDNINYKVFICYHLLLSSDNLIINPAFYTILLIFIITIFISIKFLLTGFSKLRIMMYKELPTDEKVRKLIYKQIKKYKCKNTKIKNTIITHEDKIIKKKKKIIK